MSRNRQLDQEQLSEAESDELAMALGDGFIVHGHLMPDTAYSLKDVVEEPFWGAKVSGGNGRARVSPLPDWLEDLRQRGLSPSEFKDEVKGFLSELVAEDAPDWTQTNPFGFQLTPLKGFFMRRFEEVRASMGFYWPEDEARTTAQDLMWYFPPFTKPWLECAIIVEIEYLEFLVTEEGISDGLARVNAIYARQSAGKIGRMVEQYRWRFSYGRDALRGRGSVEAASSGGQTRAAELREQSAAVLTHMERLVGVGHSVRRAAELAHRAGLGASANANRQLWKRTKGQTD